MQRGEKKLLFFIPLCFLIFCSISLLCYANEVPQISQSPQTPQISQVSTSMSWIDAICKIQSVIAICIVMITLIFLLCAGRPLVKEALTTALTKALTDGLEPVKGTIQEIGNNIKEKSVQGIKDGIVQGMKEANLKDQMDVVQKHISMMVNSWERIAMKILETIDKNPNIGIGELLNYNITNTDKKLEEELKTIKYLRENASLSDAMNFCETLSQQYPNSIDIMLEKAILLQQTGDLDTALTLLLGKLSDKDKAISKNAKVELLLRLTVLYKKLGNKEMAETYCKQALELAPLDPRLLNEMSFLLWEKKDFENALKKGEEAFKQKIDDVQLELTIKNNYGFYLAQRGKDEDIDKALSITERLKLFNNYYWLDTAGFIRLKKYGNAPTQENFHFLEEAIDLFYRAIALVPPKDILISIQNHLDEAIRYRISHIQVSTQRDTPSTT